MKVKCIFNTPEDIHDNPELQFNYGLNVGEEYEVMGICLTCNQLWFLTDVDSRPSYFPSQLFDVIDKSLRDGWYFDDTLCKDDTFPFDRLAVWGYYELCMNKDHYSDLLERDKEALQLYFKRKNELTVND